MARSITQDKIDFCEVLGLVPAAVQSITIKIASGPEPIEITILETATEETIQKLKSKLKTYILTPIKEE